MFCGSSASNPLSSRPDAHCGLSGRGCRRPKSDRDLFMPAGYRQLRSQNRRAYLVAILADLSLLRGRLPAIVLSSATTCLRKSFRRSRTPFRDRSETVRLHRGTGVHLHPGILIDIIPEHCSESSRNRVHLVPESPIEIQPCVMPRFGGGRPWRWHRPTHVARRAGRIRTATRATFRAQH
jgi:hypothetical protein